MLYLLIFIGTCNLGWIADFYCDDINNNIECNYDGGDCCGPNANTLYCQECLCLNDTITLPPTIDNETTSRLFYFLKFSL